jgi:hypothetical protein
MAHLFHFSEDPTIERFEPRALATRPGEKARVWAIDEWHAPLYYFPRDCPRILLWPLPSTTAADRERWFGGREARMLAHIEAGWLERMRTTAVYRYVFDGRPFENLRDAGMHVSASTVTPLRVEPVGDLLQALNETDIELVVLERLTPLRGVWDTTLHASGIRLRNAIGWDANA